MRQVLTALLVLSVAALVGCRKQQKQAPAAAVDTTAAGCDSAALANCCPGDSTANCGGCLTPAAPTDTANGAAEPCPPGG